MTNPYKRTILFDQFTLCELEKFGMEKLGSGKPSAATRALIIDYVSVKKELEELKRINNVRSK